MNFFRKILAVLIYSPPDTKSTTSCKLTPHKTESEKYDFAAVGDSHDIRKFSSSQNHKAFVTNQSHKHPTPFWGTVFRIIFLSGCSPAFLLPSSFMVVGILTGSVTVVFIFVFYLYTNYLLIWSANEVCKLKMISSVSYSDLVYEAFEVGPFFLRPFARTAQSSLSCIIILGWYGSCILLGLLMVNNLQTLCHSWPETYFAIQKVVCIIVAPILLLNLVRRLKFLEPRSTLGCLLNMAAILLVVLYATTDAVPWDLPSSYGSIKRLPQLMAVVFGNEDITTIILSLKNGMKPPDKFETPCRALTIAYVVIFSMYFSMSMFFCIEYGTSVPENVIDVIPTSLITSLITSILNVTGLYLLIPVTLYVPLDILWNDVFRERPKSSKHKFAWKSVMKVLLVILIFLVIGINLNLSFVISFLGTVTSCLQGLLFPPIVHSLVIWRVGENNTKTVLILMKNMILVILGLILTLAGIIDCMSN